MAESKGDQGGDRPKTMRYKEKDRCVFSVAMHNTQPLSGHQPPFYLLSQVTTFFSSLHLTFLNFLIPIFPCVSVHANENQNNRTWTAADKPYNCFQSVIPLNVLM